jgi:hypothetical protein
LPPHKACARAALPQHAIPDVIAKIPAIVAAYDQFESPPATVPTHAMSAIVDNNKM